MKIIKKIVEGMKFFTQLLKTNKLTRLLTGFFLVVICMKLSETWSFFDYLAILFAIYPIWLTIWLLIYAWIINPIIVIPLKAATRGNNFYTRGERFRCHWIELMQSSYIHL